MTTRTLAITLSIAFAITLGLTAYFAHDVADAEAQGKIRVEIVKYLLQLVVIIIIGGVVAGLFKSAEQSREQSKARAEIRTDYLKRLGSLYRNVKAARRALRADGLTTKYGSQPTTISHAQAQLYKEQMERINEAQLELEGLKIEAKSLPAFIPMGDVPAELKKMEDYLRQILNEYEETRPLLENGQSVQFTHLERLDEFTGTTGRSFECSRYQKKIGYRLVSHFSVPYDDVVEIVSKHII